MSECSEQLKHVCGWNRRLSRENTLLRLKMHDLEQKLSKLEKTNADGLVERAAIETALGAAMDEALKARQR